MAEGLLVFLRRDLREDLAAGFRGTPVPLSDGGLWLARWATISVFVGLILFLACGYHGGFSRLNTLAAELPEPLWQWLTVLGDERVAFTLTLFFTRRCPRVFWTLISAGLFAIAFTHSLKPLFSALRPPAVLEAGTFNLIGPGLRENSFPSGHTVTAATFFGVWVCSVRVRWLRALLLLLAVTVGLSRVVVGVHWPVDVAMGLAGGATAARLGVSLAARSEVLGSEPAIHLALVTLAVGMAVSLLLWDGGYSGAAAMQRLIAVAALSFVAYAYLIDPILRWSALRKGVG